MECKFCGTENSDDAQYCKECGFRVDGKVKCPACGEIVPAEDKFCIKCGADLTQPAKPEPTQIESEVAATQAVNEVAATQATSQTATASGAKSYDTRKIVTIAGNLFLGLAVLLSLIFVFLVGVVSKGSSSSLNSSIPLFDYFSRAYKNADEVDKIGGNYAQTFYAVNAFGTVISALGLIFVIVYAAMTAYRAYKNYYLKQQANWERMAVASFIAYVIFAAVFLGYHAGVTKTDSYTMTVSYNGATLAGIILTSICVGIYALCRAWLFLQDNKDKNARKGAGVSALVIILSAVAIGLTTLPAIVIEASSASTKTGGSFMIMLQALMTISVNSDKFDGFYWVTVIGMLCAVCLCISLGRIIYVYLTGQDKILAGKDKAAKNAKWNLIATALYAIANLIFAIVAGDKFIDICGDTYGSSVASAFSSSYTAVIFVLVLTLLAVVIALLKDKIVNGNGTNNTAANQTPEQQTTNQQ